MLSIYHLYSVVDLYLVTYSRIVFVKKKKGWVGAQPRTTDTWSCSRRILLYRHHRLILLHSQYKTLIACLFQTNAIMHVMPAFSHPKRFIN